MDFFIWFFFKSVWVFYIMIDVYVYECMSVICIEMSIEKIYLYLIVFIFSLVKLKNKKEIFKCMVVKILGVF